MMRDPETCGSAEAEVLFQTVRPLFAGHSPQVVGTALAQLTALWLAGFQPEAESDRLPVEVFRVEMMQLFTVTTLELTPVMESEYVGPQVALNAARNDLNS
jgi:hypothetical protein